MLYITAGEALESCLREGVIYLEQILLRQHMHEKERLCVLSFKGKLKNKLLFIMNILHNIKDNQPNRLTIMYVGSTVSVKKFCLCW